MGEVLSVECPFGPEGPKCKNNQDNICNRNDGDKQSPPYALVFIIVCSILKERRKTFKALIDYSLEFIRQVRPNGQPDLTNDTL